MSFCQIRWWILVLCGFFAVRPATAQSIEGTAFDISGAVVPGARVILMVDYVKQTETVTDEHGRFSFSGLQPGMYYVQIKQWFAPGPERRVTRPAPGWIPRR